MHIANIVLTKNPTIVRNIHIRALEGLDFFSGINGDEMGLKT